MYYEVNASKSSPIAPRAPSDLKRQGHVLLPNQVASPSCIALYSHRISSHVASGMLTKRNKELKQRRQTKRVGSIYHSYRRSAPTVASQCLWRWPRARATARSSPGLIIHSSGTQCSCFCPAAPLALATATYGSWIDTRLCYFVFVVFVSWPRRPRGKMEHRHPRHASRLVPVQYMQANTNVALTLPAAVACPARHPF